MENEIYAVVDASISRDTSDKKANYCGICSILVNKNQKKAKIAIDAFRPKDNLAPFIQLWEFYGVIFSICAHNWKKDDTNIIINDNLDAIRHMICSREENGIYLKLIHDVLRKSNLKTLKEKISQFRYEHIKTALNNSQRKDLLLFHELSHYGAFIAARKWIENNLPTNGKRNYQTAINKFITFHQYIEEVGWEIDMCNQ